MHNTVKLHSFLDKVISDRGSQFIAKFWQEFLKLTGVEQGLSTVYHPQTDGQTEKTNQLLEGFLRCSINCQQDNWVELLSFAEYAYNSLHSSTGATLFQTTQDLEGKPLLGLSKGGVDACSELTQWWSTLLTLGFD